AVSERGLALAAQIAGKTGCKVLGQTYNPRMARGRGRFSIDRIPYVIEQALPILKDFRHIVLVEANDPVAFFAYPNKPSMLKPEGCEVQRLTSGGENWLDLTPNRNEHARDRKSTRLNSSHDQISYPVFCLKKR